MTDHVHMHLTPRGAESARLLMMWLGQRYVHADINRTYRRSGAFAPLSR